MESTVWLQKRNAGSAPGFEWPNAGSVIEVPRSLAAELLRIKDGDFLEVQPPAVEDDGEQTGEDAEVRRGPGRPRKDGTPTQPRTPVTEPDPIAAGIDPDSLL